MDLKEKARQLPESPGVYIMKDGCQNIIYVGKAKSLKNRVSQYFQSSKRHAPKIQKMIELIREFDYIHADTELEALLLECRLIKDLKPMFNSQLKNHRKYVYLWINLEDKYPTLEIVEEKQEKWMSFGPYTSLGSAERAVNVLRENIKLRHCKALSKRSTGCLNSHLGYCIAPCAGEISEADYMKKVDEAVSFLQGKNMGLIKELESRMICAAEDLDFNRAAKYRDDIRALRHLVNKQKTIRFSVSSKSIIALEKLQNSIYKLFIIKGSRIIYKESLRISEDREALENHISALVFKYKEELVRDDNIEIAKEDIDQAQIVYSYLQNAKDCCYMIIAKSWLSKDMVKLKQMVYKLLNKLFSE